MVMITDNNLQDNGPHLVFVNKAFERSTGYSRAEAIGNNLEMLYGPSSDIHEIHRIRSAMSTRHAIRSEIISYTKSKEEFWLEIDITSHQ